MSEVKVNKISPRTACGTVTLGDSGDTFNVPCGSKINLASGGNLTVASGATITNAGTASGFGATGEISWNTTVKTTGTFTATAGIGYFLNTTGGIITVNLPAGSAGDSVAMADYAGTWDTNGVVVAPDGSEKIGGIAGDANLSTERQSVTFVYIDGTQGWVNILDSTSAVVGNEYVVATGGTITCCGNFKIHTFTGPGTFCVSQVHPSGPNNAADYVVVAGGAASGGSENSGGGGAGGYRESPGTSTCYTSSPLGAAPAAALTLTASPYTIAVGGGATAPSGGTYIGNNGNPSTFSTITGTGGGGGGSGSSPAPTKAGADGGSGGGGAGYAGAGGAAGSGNTPPFNPIQGNPGGTGSPSPGNTQGGGAGGGSGAVGGNHRNPGGGIGGTGVGTEINPSTCVGTPGPSAPLRYFGGGGGGGSYGPSPQGTGGDGGGGDGGTICVPTTAQVGTVNTGGGGGGGGPPGGTPTAGLAGGSGIVMIRYKYK
jgi:hypothetical protein